MKVKVFTQEFKTAFEKVINAALKKSSLPILENVKIDFNSNGMGLTASDLEHYIKINIEAMAEVEGTFILTNLAQFKKALKYFKDTYIEFNVTENELCISSGNKDMKVTVSYEAEDFVKIPELEGDLQEYQTTTSKLLYRVNKIKHALSKDATRPILAGYNFNKDYMVTCDGYRIALSKDDNMYINNSFTVRSGAITLLEKCIKKKEDFPISLYVTEKYIRLAYENIEITSRLIEGDYIKVEQLFPTEFKTTVATDKKELKDNVMYINEFHDKSKTPMIFNINETFEQKFSSNKGLYRTETAANIEGEELTIGVNPNYVLDVLKNIDDENVNIQFTNSVSPMTIETETEKYLIVTNRN